MKKYHELIQEIKMSELNLDVVKIVIEKITEEFQAILNLDPATYGGYNIIITNERQFTKIKEKKHKAIYIVIKFLQGNKDFGQQRQPFTLNAISEHNTIDVCQKLMMDFAETYNLSFEFTHANYTLRQTMTTVSVVNNFSEIYEGFRSLFYLSGTFYIGVNSNPITSIVVQDEDGLNEEIDFISSQMSYDIQPDSQPFYGTNNFNRSVAKIGTLSIGFTMYSINTDFYNKAMDIAFNLNNSVNINKTFTVVVTLKSGKIYSVPMKLASVSNVQELRDFPASSFTFVR